MILAFIFQRLESISDFKWKLKQIDVPSMYYGNRSKIAITTQVKNLREGFDMKDMSIPRWIRHHHGCCCYICSHPTILPITFQFYLIQVIQNDETFVLVAPCCMWGYLVGFKFDNPMINQSINHAWYCRHGI